MKYAQFILHVQVLRDRACQLFERPLLHEDPDFRKWRHELTDLIERISHEGFSINCRVAARSFDRWSPDTPFTKKDRQTAYNRDLKDTINELDTLIGRHKEFGEPTHQEGQMPLTTPERAVQTDDKPPPTSTDRADMIARFSKHWFVGLLVLCASVAGVTWKVQHELFVVPRDEKIAELAEEAVRLRDQRAPHLRQSSDSSADNATSLSKLLLSNVAVFENSSVTTPDGACTVKVGHVVFDSATIEVALGAEPFQIFESVKIGSRTVVRGANATYYVDLHRARGSIIDLSVSSGPVLPAQTVSK